MSYATEHASALADIRAAGADVTFTTTSETYTESTDTTTAGSSVTVTGAALRVKGDPIRYQALGLTVQSAVTLLFAPDTYGDRPELGSVVTWEGLPAIVRDVSPLSPDGTDILSRVVVAQ